MSNRITEPQNGGKIVVTALPGNDIQFDFDISAASLERVDDGLVFSFPEGQVVVENFFIFEGDELPTFALEDGSVFSGNDLLEAFDAADLATAAGPQGGNTGSGTTYNDDSGSGVEGIVAQGAQDGQDAQEGFAASGNPAPGGAFEQYSPNFVAAAGSASGPGAFAVPGNAPSAPGAEPGSDAGPTTDMNALFIVQQNALGNYETSLSRLQGMIQDFYEGLEGQNVGTVSFGAVLFAGSMASSRTLGPIEVDFNDPDWQASALISLQSAVNDLLDNAHNVKTSDFGLGFKAATEYVADNWGESDAVNKVFFVSNGQMSRSNIDENGNTVGWSNTAGAVTGSSANSQQAGYVINENGVKVLGTVNDFQVAVDAFNNFVDQASSLTGSTVDVHALGVTSGYGNNMIGDNLTQYHNQLLSFFDNTGNGNLEADAHVKASANGKDLYLDNWEGVDPGAVASVAGYDLLGKMALAAALNNEYTAMQIDSSGLVEGDGNHIAYLKGGKLEVTFGDGDDIVYAGGSGTINLGDGDNYVNTAYYQSVNITSGDGDNYAHINNCGAKVAFGEGADTVMLAGGFNNTINVGGGDDLVVVHNRGNVITLGDGNDTVELNWMIANNDKLEAGSTTKVVAMATNTITDFTVGEDVLNIGNLIGNDQSLDDYLKDYAKLELDDGGNLRITFSHSGEEQGYYRGNGGEQGWNYNVSAGQVATSEVVLQNFTANNSQFSNADLTSNDLSADEQALHTLMQILGSSG